MNSDKEDPLVPIDLRDENTKRKHDFLEAWMSAWSHKTTYEGFMSMPDEAFTTTKYEIGNLFMLGWEMRKLLRIHNELILNAKISNWNATTAERFTVRL